MELDHIIRPTARLYLLILLIGLFLGVTLALPLPAFAQDGTPFPTLKPTETPAPTAEPVTQEQAETVTGEVEDTPLNIPAALTIVVALAGLFASMPGVSLLQSAIVNIGKAVGIVTDGNAPRAYALLTLALFGVLVYFQLFRHTVDLETLDSAFGQLGTIASFIGVSVVSLIVGPRTHEALVRLGIPGVSKSHTPPVPAIQPYPESVAPFESHKTDKGTRRTQ